VNQTEQNSERRGLFEGILSIRGTWLEVVVKTLVRKVVFDEAGVNIGGWNAAVEPRRWEPSEFPLVSSILDFLFITLSSLSPDGRVMDAEIAPLSFDGGDWNFEVRNSSHARDRSDYLDDREGEGKGKVV